MKSQSVQEILWGAVRVALFYAVAFVAVSGAITFTVMDTPRRVKKRSVKCA
jgi:hypothetical protein